MNPIAPRMVKQMPETRMSCRALLRMPGLSADRASRATLTKKQTREAMKQRA